MFSIYIVGNTVVYYWNQSCEHLELLIIIITQPLCPVLAWQPSPFYFTIIHFLSDWLISNLDCLFCFNIVYQPFLWTLVKIVFAVALWLWKKCHSFTNYFTTHNSQWGKEEGQHSHL